VHLRIEKDARDWSQIMGGPEVRQTLAASHPQWSTDMPRARNAVRQQHAELRKHA
jgi:hypothetical protein